MRKVGLIQVHFGPGAKYWEIHVLLEVSGPVTDGGSKNAFNILSVLNNLSY